jgi:Leucine-rich repeat (LRR) protein
MACLSGSLKALDLQHTATCLTDAAAFLAAVGRLTLLTELCCSNNQLAALPPQWSSLNTLQVHETAASPSALSFVLVTVMFEMPRH